MVGIFPIDGTICRGAVMVLYRNVQTKKKVMEGLGSVIVSGLWKMFIIAVLIVMAIGAGLALLAVWIFS